MTMFKKNGGFTLVELIVVIAILAILAGVAIPAYSGYITKANEAADITALSAIKTAAMAACSTEGTVTEITVSTDSGKVSTINVKYEGNNTGVSVLTEDANTDVDDDFRIYWGITDAEKYPTLKSDTFKNGAKWSATGTNANEWVKKS